MAVVQIEVEVWWQVQAGSHQTTVTVGMTGDIVMVPFMLMLEGLEVLEVMVGMASMDVPEVTFAGGGMTSPNATPKRGEYLVPSLTCDRESS